MIPAAFDYDVAESLEHALELLSDGGSDTKLLAGGGLSRRRLNKLSCAGWLPHDRGFVSGLPKGRASARWPADNR